ncbi:MAG: hypothetical protein V4489_06680 [Chlamydiota bacterium]
MHKKWLLRIKEIEIKSLLLNQEEQFDAWLLEHYPKGPINYFKLIGKVPQEFCSVFLDRVLNQISILRSTKHS